MGLTKTLISFPIQRRVGVVSIILLVGTLLASCFSSTKKLDETVFFDSAGFKLKLIRYYDNIPLHYSGEISVIHCATDQTRNIHTYSKTQEDGWVEVDHIGALGSNSSADVLKRAQLGPRVIDQMTLMITGANRFLATFDGCRTFITWQAWRNELLIQQSKPEHCQHDPKQLCPGVTPFEGVRQIHFSDFRFVRQSGIISFLVESKAFNDGRSFAVSSQDRGRTWTTKALK